MVVGLMIEDIWQNFDNYKLQSQVMLKRHTFERSTNKTKQFEEEQLVEPL
jgi:hypothetical protein